MQIKVRVRFNSELAPLFSALFGDELPVPHTSKRLQDGRSILHKVDKMIIHRLFGAGAWPANDDELYGLNQALHKFGLTEIIRGEPETVQASPLGRELHVFALEGFLGMCADMDVPAVFSEFVDDELEDYLWKHLKDDDVLKVVAQRAYLRYRDMFHLPRNPQLQMIESVT